MKTKKNAYQEFEGLPAWAVIEQAIESLVQNKDLIEQTDRRYIVGLLVRRLNEKEMLTTGVPCPYRKHRRSQKQRAKDKKGGRKDKSRAKR